MIYRVLLIIAIVYLSFFVQAVASELTFEKHDSIESIKYDLILRADGIEKAVWSKVIEKINGHQPYAWCKLIVWSQNDNGFIALVENNEFSITVLQADSGGDGISSLERSDPGWLREWRRGAKFEAEAPNKIIVKPSGGKKPMVYKIVDRKILSEDGEEVDPPSTIQIGQGNASIPQKMAETNDAPKAAVTPTHSQLPRASDSKSLLPSERQNSFISWTLASIFAIAAIGLVIFLLKRRSR